MRVTPQQRRTLAVQNRRWLGRGVHVVGCGTDFSSHAHAIWQVARSRKWLLWSILQVGALSQNLCTDEVK